MNTTKRSTSGSLSWHDVVSWAKNTLALIIPVIAIEILKITPVIQDYLMEKITILADGNSTIIAMAFTVIGSLSLLFKKWITDYTK